MAKTVKSDYYERIKNAIRFIEANLKNELSVDLIADKACFSKYHFIRLFSAMVGETVGSYVRMRRISKSAKELILTNKPIFDLAIEYQFESQAAYTRSFKRVYNITPGKYRKHGLDQIAFGRSGLSNDRLKHLSTISLEPKISTISEKKLAGIRVKTSLADNKIPQMWQKFMSVMNEIKNNKNTGWYELHPYDSDFKAENFTETMEFEKMAAVEVVDFKDLPKGMGKHILSGGKYAVFTHKGLMKNVQMSFDFIYGSWLAKSGFELDTRDDFEHYGEKYLGPDTIYSEMEICIPIK